MSSSRLVVKNAICAISELVARARNAVGSRVDRTVSCCMSTTQRSDSAYALQLSRHGQELFALGVRLCEVSFEHWEVGLVGALVCPLTGLLTAALVSWLIPLSPMQQAMVWVFASLPPALLNFLIADRYHQEPAKVAAIVLIGNLGSILFVPVGLILALQKL